MNASALPLSTFPGARLLPNSTPGFTVAPSQPVKTPPFEPNKGNQHQAYCKTQS